MNLRELHRELSQSAAYREAYDEEDLIHRVAERAYQLRTKLELTQEEVAERLGTSQPAIAKLEGGFVNLTLRRLVRLARALDCGAEDLVTPEQPLTLEEDWGEDDETGAGGEVIPLASARARVSTSEPGFQEGDGRLHMAAGV